MYIFLFNNLIVLPHNANYVVQHFEDIQRTFAKRNTYVVDNYINTQNDVNAMWDIYKKDYSMYL